MTLPRAPLPCPAASRRRVLARLPFLVLAVWLALPGTAVLRADIEFVGVLATPQRTMFALFDTATGRNDWVAIGGSFSGYRVEAYRVQEDSLSLTKGDVEMRVRLKSDARVKSQRIELAGTITMGTGEDVEITRATLLFDQENTFPLKDGMVCRITPQRRDDGSIAYQVSFERVLAENKREKISAPAITALPGQQFSMRMQDFGFSFTPRAP